MESPCSFDLFSLISIYLKYYYFYCCGGACKCHSWMWRSGGNSVKSIFFQIYIGYGDWTQVTRYAQQTLYLQTHINVPSHCYFLFINPAVNLPLFPDSCSSCLTASLEGMVMVDLLNSGLADHHFLLRCNSYLNTNLLCSRWWPHTIARISLVSYFLSFTLTFLVFGFTLPSSLLHNFNFSYLLSLSNQMIPTVLSSLALDQAFSIVYIISVIFLFQFFLLFYIPWETQKSTLSSNKTNLSNKPTLFMFQNFNWCLEFIGVFNESLQPKT